MAHTDSHQFKLSIPSDAVVGQHIKTVCLAFMSAVAFVYAAGYCFGHFIHRLNDRLAFSVRFVSSFIPTIMRFNPDTERGITLDEIADQCRKAVQNAGVQAELKPRPVMPAKSCTRTKSKSHAQSA